MKKKEEHEFVDLFSDPKIQIACAIVFFMLVGGIYFLNWLGRHI